MLMLRRPIGAVRRVSRDLPAAQQRVAGTSEELPVRVSRTRRARLTRRMLLAVPRDLVDQWQRSAPTVVAHQPGDWSVVCCRPVA